MAYRIRSNSIAGHWLDLRGSAFICGVLGCFPITAITAIPNLRKARLCGLPFPASFLYTTNTMSRVWRTLKGYLFWTYDRGSFHYDVMVTLILLFIFVAPRIIDFKDRPTETQNVPRTEITVTPDGRQGFIYQVDAAEVDAQDMAMVRRNLQRTLRPIAGNITIDRVEPVRDSIGRIVAYRAWARR